MIGVEDCKFPAETERPAEFFSQLVVAPLKGFRCPVNTTLGTVCCNLSRSIKMK